MTLLCRTSHPGGNKLGAGKAKYKYVFRPRPILGHTTWKKSAEFSICFIDCSQGSYSYIILTLSKDPMRKYSMKTKGSLLSKEPMKIMQK